MTAVTEPQPTPDTGTGERLSYAGYFLGQNIVYQLVQLFLVVYAVTHLQLNAALVATVIVIVRVWDAVNDPLIGVLLDRFRRENNRFKYWLNVTAFLVPVATFIMFIMPSGAPQPLKIGYFVVTYLIWDVVFTISEVSIFSISTAMTINEKERSVLLTLTQIGSVLGALIGFVLSGVLLDDGGLDLLNWPLLGLLTSLAALAVMLPQMFTVKERYVAADPPDISLLDMVRDVLRNDQHFIIMSLYLSQMFLNAMVIIGLFVAEGYYGQETLASISGAASLLGVLVLGAFTPAIIKRIGKKRYLEIAMILTIVLSIPLFFIPPSGWVVAAVFATLRIAFLVVTSLLRPMFTADAVEYGHDKTGVRNDASAFAIQTFFNKTGDALGQGLGALLLAVVAYNELVGVNRQAPGTIEQLWLWFIVLPMIMAAVMWLGSRFFYKLDEATVAKLIEKNRAYEADTDSGMRAVASK